MRRSLTLTTQSGTTRRLALVADKGVSKMADSANIFTLRVRLGNSTMRYHADVARALREVADYLDTFTESDAPICTDSDAIHDHNGNHVGGWNFSKEEA